MAGPNLENRSKKRTVLWNEVYTDQVAIESGDSTSNCLIFVTERIERIVFADVEDTTINHHRTQP